MLVVSCLGNTELMEILASLGVSEKSLRQWYVERTSSESHRAARHSAPRMQGPSSGGDKDKIPSWQARAKSKSRAASKARVASRTRAVATASAPRAAPRARSKASSGTHVDQSDESGVD